MRYLILLVLIGFLSCTQQKQDQEEAKGTASVILNIEVSNPLDQLRQNVMVVVSEEELPENFDPAAFVVMNGDQEIPSQYNDKGERGVVFVIDSLKANGNRQFTLQTADGNHNYEKRTQAELSVKKGGRFENREYIGGKFENVDSLRVPDEHTDHSWYIRYEGPGWESDKVGYRFYLDWRNATDVFGKKTHEMVLQNVGQDGFDSYHEMGPWGMDVLKVGESLGIGTLAIFHNGKAVRVDKTDSVIAKILENGPVYSAIQTNYYGWNVAGQSLDVNTQLSIHAGTRLTHYRVSLKGGNLDNLCTGIGKDEKTIVYTQKGNDQQWGYLATYGVQSLNNDKIGLAVLFPPARFMEFTEDEHSHVVKLEPASGKLDYYFLAAWELEPNGITNEEAFMDYVNKTAKELANPVKVSVKKP